MRIFWCSLGWLVLFAACGAAALLGAGLLMFHSLALAKKISLLGAEFGLNLFTLAICFALLPGARRPPAAPQPFGLAQGIWGMAGFVITMVAAGALAANLLVIENFALIARHADARVDLTGAPFVQAATCAGELGAALFVVWYLRRLGPANATALAWRPAPPGAYAAATACGLAIIAIVLTMFHFIPPDASKLADLPMAKLFTGSAIAVLPVLVVAGLLGPVLEEIVFRGIAFGGIATRLGPVWAGVITSVIFIVAHYPEKKYYLPGFFDVGLFALAAVLLRLKFGSIRPGIWMHILYNTGSAIAASLIQ